MYHARAFVRWGKCAAVKRDEARKRERQSEWVGTRREGKHKTLHWFDWRVKGWAGRAGVTRPAPTAVVEKQGQGMALWASLAVVMLLRAAARGGGQRACGGRRGAANWPSPLLARQCIGASRQHAPRPGRGLLCAPKQSAGRFTS